MKMKNRKGFTLLEILLVVAAIAILAGIVIVAINPGKQLAETRNAQRRMDVNTILNATYQYMIDSKGILPATITSASPCTNIAASNVCKTGGTCTTGVNLAVLTTNEKYLTAIPTDPLAAAAGTVTDYHITKSTNGRITVCAPSAEQAAVISVTK